MSPVLAYECLDTPPPALPCKPRVRAGLYTPRGLHSEGALTHAPVEASSFALAVDTAEERLCPCKSGTTTFRASDKQLRATPWPYQPQGASELSVWPHRNTSPRESRAWGLGTGAALGSRQAYATLPGPSDLVVARPPKRSQGMKVV